MNYAFEMYSGAMIYVIYHWKCGFRLALSKGLNLPSTEAGNSSSF
jgi:hypothetical protein